MELWEEALDVDDSDLFPSLQRPSTLVPCKRPQTKTHNDPCKGQTLSLSSQSQIPQEPPNPETLVRRLIPGPAGATQAAMLRQNAQAGGNGNDSRVGDSRPMHESEDEDFNGNPWLCALHFLGVEAGSSLPHSIKATQNMERVPQIVGIIKSCTPNGLGDLIVTLKDPTGTIGASIHRKVLAESMSGRDISLGSVLILKQVVVFSPTRSSRYINVTLNNVVKIISKNSGPPPKQGFPAFKVRRPALEEHMEIWPRMTEKVASISKGADGGANGAVRRDDKDKGMADERRAEDAAGSFNCRSTLHHKNASVVEEPNHETCGRSGVKKPISKVPLANWTDEQLHELFAEDDNALCSFI